MEKRVLAIIGLLLFYGSMVGMFFFIGETVPSQGMLLLFPVAFIGGGILAVWAHNKKFPNHFFILALAFGYFSFLFFGMARVARTTSFEESMLSMLFFVLALLLGIISFVFATRSE